MIRAARLLFKDRSGNAAAEMALVLPLLLVIMFGSAELGNYFMNEHGLIKSLRDGARYAARQDFSNYPDCATVSGAVQTSTKDVVMNGYVSGGTSLLTPNISASDITITTRCAANVGGQDMKGIYDDHPAGAQVVIVSASVPYRSILGAFGFGNIDFQLNAAQEAAVSGL